MAADIPSVKLVLVLRKHGVLSKPPTVRLQNPFAHDSKVISRNSGSAGSLSPFRSATHGLPRP